MKLSSLTRSQRTRRGIVFWWPGRGGGIVLPAINLSAKSCFQRASGARWPRHNRCRCITLGAGDDEKRANYVPKVRPEAAAGAPFVDWPR